MSATPRVDYMACARRHNKDAHILLHKGRRANAGQLFGFSVECGLKALLVRAGASVDGDGNILKVTGLREHLPKLGNLVTAMTALPDGRAASIMLSHLPHLGTTHDWHTNHRYWRGSAVPITASLDNWEMAALEMDALLDEVVGGRVL